MGIVLTKYVKPRRWADPPVDQVLGHTSVVAHIVRTHLVNKQIRVVVMLLTLNNREHACSYCAKFSHFKG